MQVSINNVINISVAASQQGAGEYNTSNLALFTSEAPDTAFSEGYKIYLDPAEVAEDFGTDTATAKMANAVFSQKPNILAGRGYLVVIPLLDDGTLETIAEAVTRTKDLVQYFGIITTEVLGDPDLANAAAVIQPLKKMGFFGSSTAADIDPDGLFDLIRQAGQDQTRCLYYGSAADDEALTVFTAAYAGRALSTNFQGSNTTSTMHLKDLIGVTPDTTLDQTELNKAKDAGADVYVSIQGVPKVFTSGGNGFFDDVYNLLWFVGSLEIAGFNTLAQTSTKVPQTTSGIDSLKKAYRLVAQQSVRNQFVAAGQWNSPNTFGVQEDFFNNIEERGFYIYSAPLSQQAPANREDRIAPLIQIAIKFAGAVHSSDVIVSVNP